MTAAPDPVLDMLAPRATGTAGQVILDMQDAFRKGDYARMSTLYHDDVDWLFHGPTSVFPDVGRRSGKIEVFKTLAALNGMYRFERYVTDQLIAEGDWAAGIADVTLAQRTSGRVIHCKIASFHRVRNGQVIEYRGFTDSFDAVEQVLGHELPL
ncbi:MAG TPA: nuclear transport factor 2 family protein [Pseudolabrys sp.]|nr:nuclear transport factor 2 family protein [Pseudolabrys sp.]